MEMLKNVEIIEKKSRFIGYLYSCHTEEELKSEIARFKNEHNKATHICYGARMTNPFFEKAFDDGEPSGTAGRPILSVLQKRELNNVCAIVVRYFGGVKLGAGGLVRAYSKVTSELCK